MEVDNKKKIISLVAFPLIFLCILLLFIFLWQKYGALFFSAEKLQEWIGNYGILAPIVFIVIQALQVIIFVIPGEIPQVAGGYLFGMVLGSVYSIAGILLGSAFNFFIGKKLGLPFVEAVFGQKNSGRILGMLNDDKKKRIVIGIFFILFVIPGLPKDVLTYLAGISTIPFGFFMLVSGLGRLPGIIGSAVMGDAAASQNWTLLIVISTIALVLFLIGFLYRDKIMDLIHKHSQGKRKPEVE
ncbi:MAG: TVP38/TMEM64 family protein [Spirochaetales bacterium]|nr:TVP38/TMEM64 family protein [Spirochaetales bacterium]